MLGPQLAHEQLVGNVGGVVLVHVDLFEDDMPLRVDLLLAERRALQHLAEHVDRVWQVGGAQLGPVDRVLLGGEGVVAGADGVEALCDFMGSQLSEPLKSRCSRKWLQPASAGVSSRLPVSTQAPIVAEWTDGMSWVMTRRPLGSVESS